MQFGVLGPLQVITDSTGEPGAVLAPRLRVLLAVLLWRAGQPVAVDELAELVWDGAPPGRAPEATRALIMRLRRQLGNRASARIITRAPGYAIEVSGGELDAARFETATRQAGVAVRAGRWAQAARSASGALELWRGTPLADIPSQLLADRWVPHLEQLHEQALEYRLEAGLHQGRHKQLIPELQDLTARHPLRESLHGQLMLALYLCGRQGEALAAYQRARGVLVAELGVEPGPGLRGLHQQMLSGDPALAIPGTARPGQRAHQRAVPRALPPAVPGFAGRAAELSALTRILDQVGAGAPGTAVISAIGGTAGVGKTALAIYWAHQVADRFGDGQLYVNLRGFGPSAAPAAPAGVIRAFLDALGVAPERIPASSDAQAGLYRSLLADRRMLIVLDNARDEDQVRPLLPASPASLVIVTSRSQLAGLAAADGARLLSLDVLAHGEAVQLLTARLGADRAAAEPGAAGQIAALCAHLPLALAVAAARAAARPSFPLAALAAELRDWAGRLDALDAGDPAASVAGVFSWSYQQLSPAAARMFRLLGLHPGPDVSAPAAASLAGCDPVEARRLLAELTRDCLLTEHTPGRYAFHDLLRAYAASQAREHDSQPDRDAAAGRVLDHYLHTGDAAALLLHPSFELAALTPARPGVTPEHITDYQRALAWFAAEHHVLHAAVTLAAETGSDIHAWQIPWTMAIFLNWRGQWQEWAAIERTAVAAATRLGATAGQAVSRRLLANACGRLAEYDEARAHLTACLQLYQRLGDRSGQGRAHQSLSWVAGCQERYADALGHAEQALRLFKATGDQAGQADMLNDAGWAHAQLGNYQQASTFCQHALALHRKASDPHSEACAWETWGYAEHHLGHHAKADDYYARALAIFRDLGAQYQEAEALANLGDCYHAADNQHAARRARQQALDILDNLHHPDAALIRAKLATPNGHRPHAAPPDPVSPQPT